MDILDTMLKWMDIYLFIYLMQWTTGKNEPTYGPPHIYNQADAQYILDGRFDNPHNNAILQLLNIG